ncbi:YfcC family protein [Atopobacter sp. AH10]|uniref:YfcC family protein n=1 Tax=Atopobacter sp. AH10 TaxID=2315861 RepID=UPI000EF24205|nr:YfcC family protein [Atopobacter sp. AH10]RLK63689.1 YfcC family protein [Atopobacter sp. AH10]
METNEKKGFKMPSSFVILFLIIAVMAVLTWVIPAGKYDVDKAGNLIAGTYKQVASNPQGIWDVLMAPIHGMLGKGDTGGSIEVAFFILMVGGFLGVVNETGALDAGIASTVRKYKGKEKMLIPVLMFLFALGGSTYGMAEETMAFYPLIVPVMMAVGFDAVVGTAIILLGSQLGCLASTVNPFATGVASNIAGVSLADGIGLRLLIFAMVVVLGVAYVWRYASKVEKDPKASIVYGLETPERHAMELEASDGDVRTLTKKQSHVLMVFALTFVIMIMSLIPWGTWTNFFSNSVKGLTNAPAIGTILGKDLLPFGEWYFPEITMLFLFMAVLVGFIYGISEERFIDVFLHGAADLLSVALIVAVARGIQVIMNDGQITATVLYWGEQSLGGLSKPVFIVLTYIFYLPLSFLIPSTSGLAGATMGIMAPLGEFNGVARSLVITAYQSANGLLNLISPTSAIVMGGLSLSNVPIEKWWKFVMPLIGAVVVGTVIVLVLGTMI